MCVLFLFSQFRSGCAFCVQSPSGIFRLWFVFLASMFVCILCCVWVSFLEGLSYGIFKVRTAAEL